MWIARGGDGGEGGEGGQASIELIALLPALALIAAVAIQALLAGSTFWLTATAAREAARAHALGGDPTVAARVALPSWSRGDLHVTTTSSGTVRVRVEIPSVVGGLRLGSVSVPAHMESQR